MEFGLDEVDSRNLNKDNDIFIIEHSQQIFGGLGANQITNGCRLES